MLLSQASFAAVFWLRGNASPWKAAAAGWTVWGTLVDVGCRACLFSWPGTKTSHSRSPRAFASLARA